MKHRAIRSAMAVVVVGAVLTGCGGGDTAEPATTSTDAVEATTTTEAAATTTEAPAATTTTAQATESETAGDGVELMIEAEDSEGFNVSRLEAPAGVEVTLTFDNKDTASGEKHNWRVQTDEGDYFTELNLGPSTDSVTFTVNTPGEYDFFCDTHLTAMRGTLVVTP